MSAILAGAVALLTPADDIAVSVLKGDYGLKPFIILAVGALLAYLALTGKADRLFSSVFGAR